MRLYPEDIEKLYYMVPDGMPVRVVNQPFLFGWKDHQLYLQAYTVLEDDTRDWDHAQQKLLSRTLAQHIQKALKDAGQQINWESVKAITHAPRGLPVPVTGTDSSLDAVLAAAPMVENRIPDGADWDGSDANQDNGNSAKPLLLEREPAATATAPAATKPASGG
jgi:L,D-transpeptidase ErfK/SrfK